VIRLSALKRAVRPIVPIGLIELRSRQQQKREAAEEEARRQRFEQLRHVVGETLVAIDALTEARCSDAEFLEKKFIPSLGLNDERLMRQPPEFLPYYGKGLHIWQYPSQLAAYLVWLTRNSRGITSYMEIGCRWGGMFILISQWIQKNGGQLRNIVAVDPIEPTPFIKAYFELLGKQSPGRPLIQATYVRDLSNSSAVRELVDRVQPNFVFIDADHRLRGVFSDHMLAREHAQIIVHHDICSERCVDTTFLWESLKKLETHEFDFYEFVSQYPSVKGNFLGIGAMKRKLNGRTDALTHGPSPELARP
jgi:cephalosporin hydroxylase